MTSQFLLTFVLCMVSPRIEAPSKMFATDTLGVIADLRWKQRVILVRPRDDRDAGEVLTALRDADSEIEDRHIYWFLFLNGRLETNARLDIGKQFIDTTVVEFFGSNDSNVVLIGKDGGVKDRSASLRLDDLFALIDTMPMRRSEMSKNP